MMVLRGHTPALRHVRLTVAGSLKMLIGWFVSPHITSRSSYALSA